ncbi:hypothetical protein Q8W71_22990 [Methylobacterium sp. NEAU 140]|uniref:hypothetical protein n=1 Tax=Methylobacterium sp. NEAU 140 TaxID=3064945 RepID=UPI002733ADB9|nr:hypothetical protein [Methylobacterium sp. NEAU 140]MDP4025504.1 hypothetical protein [Methylobacterium sp. NEAU 140]
MARSGYVAAAAAMLAATLLALHGRLSPSAEDPPPEPARRLSPVAAPAVAATPTLYCEFNNFAALTPLVGYFFALDPAAGTANGQPAYAQIFRREQDGSEVIYGGPETPRPLWTYDGASNPAVLHDPGGETINLYDDDAAARGTRWFEAGLRSIRYRNLGGRCRRSGPPVSPRDPSSGASAGPE